MRVRDTTRGMNCASSARVSSTGYAISGGARSKPPTATIHLSSRVMPPGALPGSACPLPTVAAGVVTRAEHASKPRSADECVEGDE